MILSQLRTIQADMLRVIAIGLSGEYIFRPPLSALLTKVAPAALADDRSICLGFAALVADGDNLLCLHFNCLLHGLDHFPSKIGISLRSSPRTCVCESDRCPTARHVRVHETAYQCTQPRRREPL